MKIIRLFVTGMLVSFLGTLPLGTLNIAAMQISISDGYRPALWFIAGCLLVEVIYVRISLVAIDKIRKHERILKMLEWFTLLVVIALAVSSFAAALQQHGEAKNVILSNTMHRFFLGAMMSALNPVQIPFWFGWSTVLFTKKILLPRNDFYNIYIGGIGMGTLMGNSLFIFGGKWVVTELGANQNSLNWVIGGIFSITALVQMWKMYRHKDAAQKIHDIPEDQLHPEEAAKLQSPEQP